MGASGSFWPESVGWLEGSEEPKEVARDRTDRHSVKSCSQDAELLKLTSECSHRALWRVTLLAGSELGNPSNILLERIQLSLPVRNTNGLSVRAPHCKNDTKFGQHVCPADTNSTAEHCLSSQPLPSTHSCSPQLISSKCTHHPSASSTESSISPCHPLGDSKGTTWPYGRPRVVRSSRSRTQLLLTLILATATLLSGTYLPLPVAAAASWRSIWGKGSKTASTTSSLTNAAEEAIQLGIGLPYGWRKYVPGGGVVRAAGGSAKRDHVDGKASGKVAAAAAGIIFSAGRIPVEVNPSGNIEALLSYDPSQPSLPPSPLPPSPPPPVKPCVRAPPSPNAHLDHRGAWPTNADLAFRDLLLNKSLPYDVTKPYKLPEASYRNADFVFATGSCPPRYILAQSTRAWRRGIRAFFATNTTRDLRVLNERNKVHGEHFAYFPDDGTEELGRIWHGSMLGDSRAAMAPFLAHEHFGETYKWMLYGDDDTLFYLPAVKRLVAHLDPELPIALSDNLWYRSRHPNLFAPRCLPCHIAVDADPPVGATQGEATATGQQGATGEAEVGEPQALHLPNITEVMDGYLHFVLGVRSPADMASPAVQALLRKRTFTDFNRSLTSFGDLPPNASLPGERYLPRPACPFCTVEAACTPAPPLDIPSAFCGAAGGHGGAGMILSVGLLRRLSVQRMKNCIMKHHAAPGGDSLMSVCLWEAGYAFTDPGPSVLSRYDGNHVLFSSEAAKWALHDPLTVMLRGKCEGRCKWLLRHAASHHGRGRHFQSFQQSAAYLYANMASGTALHKWQAFMAGRDGDLAELEALARGEGGGKATA